MRCVYLMATVFQLITKKAFELFKFNWEQYCHVNSLYEYAECYDCGHGVEKDYKKACELHKLNWEQNNHARSLHRYANYHYYGDGIPKNIELAYKLFKLNWEKNQHRPSKSRYEMCLKKQLGGIWND